MLPPPPGLLTTVIEVLTSLLAVRIASTVRAVLSLLPPGTEVTTISRLRCGDQTCAQPTTDDEESSRPVIMHRTIMASSLRLRLGCDGASLPRIAMRSWARRSALESVARRPMAEDNNGRSFHAEPIPRYLRNL